MNLQDLNSPLPKKWLNIQSQTLTCEVLTAQSANIPSTITDAIQLIEVAGVPNPPPGSAIIWVSPTGQLSSTNSAGATKEFMPTDGSLPMSGNLDMNSHEVKGVTAVRTDTGDVVIGLGASATGSSVAIGNGANGGFNTGVSIGSGASVNAIGVAVGQGATCTGNNDVAIGAGAETHNQTDIALGDGAIAAGGIAIGQSSNAANGFAIAIGDTCVNAAPNSCLIGDSAILNIRPNSAICDLGTSTQPFKACWLKDMAPAVSCPFQMFGPRTIGNVTTETTLSDGVHAGSLFFTPINNPFACMLRIKVNYMLTIGISDTLDLTFKVNNNPVLTHTVGGAPVTNQLADLIAEFSFSTTPPLVSRITPDSGLTTFASATNTIVPSNNNTFTLTGQFSGTDGNALFVNYMYAELLYNT